MVRIPVAIIGITFIFLMPLSAIAQNVPGVPATAADVIFLSRPAEDSPATTPPILERELLRQALLMAGRDVGLYTYDEVLGENAPAETAEGKSRKIGLTIALDSTKKRLLLEFSAANGKQSQFIETPTFTAANQQLVPDLPALSIRTEELSRKEFADWLKAAKFTGNVKPEVKGEAIPSALEARLTELTIFGAYDAVRRAHQAIRKDGPSPAMLEVLARGYANLGQLTRFLWNADSEVFTARSLLYAQRLVLMDPAAARPHWVRAYALAMAGLHAEALKELGVVKGNHSPPQWVDPIEPMAKYDTEVLTDLATTIDPKYGALTRYIAFLTVENSRYNKYIISLGKSVLAVAPDCERVIDSLGETNDSGHRLGDLITESLDISVANFRRELPQINDLPQSVNAAWQAAHSNPDLNKDIADVAASLVGATDATEPSWSSLGRMLQEAQFVQAYRRVYFMVFDEKQDPTTILREEAPLFEQHRFAAVVRAMGAHFRNQPLAMDELKRVPLTDATIRFPQVMDPWDTLEWGREDFPAWYDLQVARIGATAWECERIVNMNREIGFQTVERSKFVPVLQAVSPYSPEGAAAELEFARVIQKDEGELAKLSPQFPQSVIVQRSLASYYRFRHDFLSAVSPLQICASIFPDTDTSNTLSDCLIKTHDDERWLKLMDDLAKSNEAPNDKARIRGDIAEHLMSEGKYAQALPYAQAASASGDLWARLDELRAYSGMGDWDDAAQAAAQVRNRNPFVYYMWSISAGHGDKEAARTMARNAAQTRSGTEDAAVYYHAEGDIANEIRAMQADVKRPTSDHRLLSYLWLAMAQERSGNEDAAMATRRELIARFPLSDETIELNRGYLNLVIAIVAAAGPAGQVPGFDPLQRFLNTYGDEYTESDHGAISFFIGECLLTSNDEHDQALGVSLLKDAAMHGDLNKYIAFMARVDLAKRNIDPFHPDAPAATQPAQ